MNCLQPDPALATTVRIRALLPSLAPCGARVAERVLDDPAAVAASTISALAADCAPRRRPSSGSAGPSGSPATPHSGWPWPPSNGRSEAGESRQAQRRHRPDDDLDKVVAKIAFADARAVEETAQQLDLDALHQVIDALVAARRVDIYGVGASGVRRAGLPAEAAPHRPGRVRLGRPAHRTDQRGAARPGRRRGGDLALRCHQGHHRRAGAGEEQRRHHRRVDQLPAVAAREARRPRAHHRGPRDDVPLRRHGQPARPAHRRRLRVRRRRPTHVRHHATARSRLTHDAVADRRVGRKSGR